MVLLHDLVVSNAREVAFNGLVLKVLPAKESSKWQRMVSDVVYGWTPNCEQKWRYHQLLEV